MFDQFFLSPQVKRCAIVTYKNEIYELAHELPNDLRLIILGIYEILGKCLNFINDSLEPSCPAKMDILLIVAKKSHKIAITRFVYWAISHEN